MIVWNSMYPKKL